MTKDKISKSFDAEVSKVLHLVIHSLYTKKEIFLRELISNASDALEKRRLRVLEMGGELDELKIIIKTNKEAGLLIIEDNGIGMNQEEMIANLGTIASSGTQKFLTQNIANSQNNKDKGRLIGQFGVGFYSVFMVSGLVSVYSNNGVDNTAYIWESDGISGYTIDTIEEDNANYIKQGTRIAEGFALKLRSEDLEFLEKYRIQHIVTAYSDHISFPIEFLEDGNNDAQKLNEGSAIWAKLPSEVSKEQYQEFYRHISHMPGSPWMTFHNKVEGNITYTNLLFIPDNKPFDLFHQSAKPSVKLYVKRVLITDETQSLIPSYLRFLRGVIDSEDLPLNVSRETLQNNSIVHKIKKSIVKKVVNALKQKIQKEKDEFLQFWENFGEVLKEGLCEHTLDDKEALLDVCHLYSMKSEKLITFQEYIDNMQEGQEEIYYLISGGNDIQMLRDHPQLQGYKARHIDVLLLTDHVDSFWVNVVSQYKNTSLKSISSSDIDLNKIKDINGSAQPERNQEETYKDLLQYMKDVLGDSIKDVKLSTKLTDSPACLTIPDGGMNMYMESMLIAQKQLHKRSAKILEINPEHGIIKLIEEKINNQRDEDARDLIDVIFTQACLIEGEPIAPI